MATLPIYLEVEDVAVGPVLIALRKMPGIIKMNLDISAGAPPTPPVRREAGGPNNGDRIVALLMQHGGGPLQIAEVIKHVGGSKGATYTAMYALKEKKVVKSIGKGVYELTDKSRRELLGEPKLLPGPHAKTNGGHHGGHSGHGKVSRTPSGRAATGAGRQLLIDALIAGGVERVTLGKHLAAKGMSAKSVSGILDRAKRDKIIKKVGDNYELTAEASATAKE